jgi:hypothetical protein
MPSRGTLEFIDYSGIRWRRGTGMKTQNRRESARFLITKKR